MPRQAGAQRAWLWAGWAAALPVLCAPVRDPDLWWHLSSARWMAEHHSIPRQDWLSFTRSGVEWIDFEWLSQLLFHAAYRSFGLSGLWALKAVLLAAVGLLVWRFLSRRGVPPPARAAALSLWAAAMAHRSDLRTELFSLVLFAALMNAVDEERLPALPVLAGFCLWTNLHAGFAYGLLLLGVCAAGALWAGRRRWCAGLLVAAAAGALGTLINPYGWRVYSVLWGHARDLGDLPRLIQEWGALDPGRPGHGPAWLLLASSLGLLARLWRGGAKGSGGLSGRETATMVLAVFGALALRHARFAPYFALLAVSLGVSLLGSFGWLEGKRRKAAWIAPAALAASALFSLWMLGRVRREARHDVYAPADATAFLDSNPDLSGAPLYNEWGWGGYLGFHLYPKYRVFQDGRYLFHPLFVEASKASGSPEAWAAFLDRYKIGVALMENAPRRLPMTRAYPAGESRVFQRPYYIQYMPRSRWALIHWDEIALVFADREAFPKERIAELEYTLWRPYDEGAFAEALSRGEIDLRVLNKEKARHEKELAELEAFRRRP